mmetsp:Transcript_19427/g.58548  ORF Transcript_19427/g.58548 Transcript_19427/m.58548 type:complete len:321 (+) Transcript_19427:669-1631(+)
MGHGAPEGLKCFRERLRPRPSPADAGPRHLLLLWGSLEAHWHHPARGPDQRNRHHPVPADGADGRGPLRSANINVRRWRRDRPGCHSWMPIWLLYLHRPPCHEADGLRGRLQLGHGCRRVAGLLQWCGSDDLEPRACRGPELLRYLRGFGCMCGCAESDAEPALGCFHGRPRARGVQLGSHPGDGLRDFRLAEGSPAAGLHRPLDVGEGRHRRDGGTECPGERIHSVLNVLVFHHHGPHRPEVPCRSGLVFHLVVLVHGGPHPLPADVPALAAQPRQPALAVCLRVRPQRCALPGAERPAGQRQTPPWSRGHRLRRACRR